MKNEQQILLDIVRAVMSSHSAKPECTESEIIPFLTMIYRVLTFVILHEKPEKYFLLHYRGSYSSQPRGRECMDQYSVLGVYGSTLSLWIIQCNIASREYTVCYRLLW